MAAVHSQIQRKTICSRHPWLANLKTYLVRFETGKNTFLYVATLKLEEVRFFHFWSRLPLTRGGWPLPAVLANLGRFKSCKKPSCTTYSFCETQPPASIGWVALSSMFSCHLSRIRDISSHLHYMMCQTIQTIYFLWGYDPGNMSGSTYLLLLSWTQFTVV